MNLRDGIKFINQHGVLLVFPIQNRKAPASLWSVFYPRSEMRWEWDEGGDSRVADLWRLREALSRSGKVVYAKWFQNRATFLSRALFPQLLKALNPTLGEQGPVGLSDEAHRLLRILEETSPLSTKQLKRAAMLEGRFHEAQYQRNLRELWTRLLIVGYGEVDDGAFPSLAIGATSSLFEELWKEAERWDAEEATESAKQALQKDTALTRFLVKHLSGAGVTASHRNAKTAPKTGTILHSQLVVNPSGRRS